MAISFITGAKAAAGSGPGNTTATTSSITTTGANLIVIQASNYVATSIPTITDSKGNTWTQLTASPGTIVRGVLFYCLNPTVGTGHTFTITISGGYPSLSVMAFSGVATSSAVDQQNHNAASSVSTLTTGSITPTQAGELVVAGLATQTTTINSINGGFTIGSIVDWTASQFGSTLAYLIQTTATAANPTYTLNSSGEMATEIVSFKAASGTFTKTHTTDTYTHKVGIKTHTTDTYGHNGGTKTHTTDAFKHSPITIHHTTDSLVYATSVYSYEDCVTLQTNDADLANIMTPTERGYITTDDGTRFITTASGFNVQQIRMHNTDNNSQISLSWNGQTALLPSSSTVYLQVYNFNTASWTTVDSDNTSSLSTDFDLTAVISTSVGNYFNGLNEVVMRVYQEKV